MTTSHYHGYRAKSLPAARCRPLNAPACLYCLATLQVSTGITMGPKNGIKVRLVPREVAGQQGGQDRGSRGRAEGKGGGALQEDSAPAGELAPQPLAAEA